MPGLMTGLVLVWLLTEPKTAPEQWETVGTQFGICGERGRPFACVTDGDTVTLGYGQNARRVRFDGFDAPEVDGACGAERAVAAKAQAELTRWLNSGPFEWSGGVLPPREKYGRELRAVRRIRQDGTYQYLADHMIDAGLAEGDTPWSRRDWC